MKTLLQILLTYLMLLLVNPAFGADLVVENAWVREGPPGMPMMGGFMTVKNKGTDAISISNISSPAFKSIELHETIMQDGMAKMREVTDMRIPAGESLILEPGGKHMMLFSPLHPLSAGDKVHFQLATDSGQPIEFTATVKRR